MKIDFILPFNSEEFKNSWKTYKEFYLEEFKKSIAPEKDKDSCRNGKK